MSFIISQSSAFLIRPPIMGEVQKRDSASSTTLQDEKLMKAASKKASIADADNVRVQGKTETDSDEIKTDPRKEALNRKKTEAQELLERLREEFNIIKKVWANDPKEMARQLGRIAKQIKVAVKMYSDAAKALGEVGKTASGITTPVSGGNASNPAAMDKQAEPAEEVESVKEDFIEDVKADTKQLEQQAVAEPKSYFLAKYEAAERKEIAQRAAQAEKMVAEKNMQGSDVEETSYTRQAAMSAYGKNTDEASNVKWMKAESSPQYGTYIGNMEFIQKVRGFVAKLEEEFEFTKKKAIVTLSGKAEKSEEFEDAKTEFDELREDLKDFERDVKQAMPIPGTLVSVEV